MTCTPRIGLGLKTNSWQLRIANQKLMSLKNLIGEVHMRIHIHGLYTSPPVQQPFLSPGAPISLFALEPTLGVRTNDVGGEMVEY